MHNRDDNHAQGPEPRGVTSDALRQLRRVREQRSKILSEFARLSADSLRNISVSRALHSRDIPFSELINHSRHYKTLSPGSTTDFPPSTGSPSLPLSIKSRLLSKIPYSRTRSAGPIHIDMARHSGSPVCTFTAEFPNPSDAERFITAVANKHGQLDGRQYTCSRYGKGGPAGEPVSAFVELCPDIACPDCTSLDFAPLFSEHCAREITS